MSASELQHLSHTEVGVRWRSLQPTLIPHCPWRNRQEFFEDSNSLKMESLRKLMKETVRQQVLFLVRRWQQALPKMLETLPTSSRREHVREQFYRVAQTPKGF